MTELWRIGDSALGLHKGVFFGRYLLYRGNGLTEPPGKRLRGGYSQNPCPESKGIETASRAAATARPSAVSESMPRIEGD